MDLCKVREHSMLPTLVCHNRICRVCAVARVVGCFFSYFMSGLLNLKAVILEGRWALTGMMKLKNTCFLNTSDILQQQIALDVIILHVSFI